MSVRKAIAWSFAGQIASFAASFATMVVLARLLSPREVGIYAVGLAVTGVLQAISAFGVGTYIVRERELDARTIDTAFTLNALIAVLLSVAILASSVTPWVTGGETEVGRVLRVLAIAPLFNIVEFRPATMLQRAMAFRAISLITLGRTLANAVVTIGAALLGASSLSAAYGGLAYAVTGAAAFWAVAREHAGFRLSLAGARAIAAFGLQTLSIGGISVMTARLSDVLLGRILGLSALGYYSRASALSGVLFQNVYGSVARVLLVKLADDRRANASLRAGYLLSLENVAAIMWPALVGLAVLAGPAVTLLFGERWLPAAAPLSILMMVQLLSLTFPMHHELYVLNDRIADQTKREAVRSLVGLAAFAYGCRYGLVGAAAGRLVDALIGMALFIPALPQLSGAGGRELLRAYARNALVAASAAAPAVCLMIVHRWRPDTPVSEVAAAVGAGALAWLAALRLTQHPLWAEATRLLPRGRLAS